MYADVEQVLVAYLPAAIPSLTASVETPNTLLQSLPFVQVTRIGGGDDYITDSAIVDLDIFSTSRANASALARLVHDAMMHLRHTAVGGVLIDHVETETGPMWVNYQDENVQRYVSTYRIESRVVAQPI